MNKPKVQKKPLKFDSYEALLGLENIDSDDTYGHFLSKSNEGGKYGLYTKQDT